MDRLAEAMQVPVPSDFIREVEELLGGVDDELKSYLDSRKDHLQTQSYQFGQDRKVFAEVTKALRSDIEKTKKEIASLDQEKQAAMQTLSVL